MGEPGHQGHKRSDKSGSGREPAAHHTRRVNTLLPCRRLMNPGESWEARRYDKRTTSWVTEVVHAGDGCTRVMASLSGFLRGGSGRRSNPDQDQEPSVACQRGGFAGAARRHATIRRGSVSAEGQGRKEGQRLAEERIGWEAAIAASDMMPHEHTVLECAKDWYGCGCQHDSDELCSEPGSTLEKDRVDWSSFKHGVPAEDISGLGWFMGVDVRSAARVGPTPRSWAVGDGSGEDVEIFRNRAARDVDMPDDGGVTPAGILYSFKHQGNPRMGSGETGGPVMEYVHVYDFVTCGRGRAKQADAITEHRTYFLQAVSGRRPSVFLSDAIRRHVDMSHMCPISSYIHGIEEEQGGSSSSGRVRCRQEVPPCGFHAGKSSGVGKVWGHHYSLTAAPHPRLNRDIYLLNEHRRNRDP